MIGQRGVRRSLDLRRALAFFGTLGVASGVLFATGPPAPGPVATAGASSKPAVPACDLQSLTKVKSPVTISFWESMVTANGKTLQTLTTKFNASQSKVHVTLVQQRSYTTTWVKYQAGLSNGQLPDVVQLTEIDLQGVDDSRSVLPVQSCMNASHYKTSDFIPRVLSAYELDGEQIGMPFAASGPVLLYNQKVFAADGITSAPATLTALVADAATLKAHGSGMALKLDPWHLETWLATADKTFVNHDNGRTGRATAVSFGTSASLKIWTDLDKLVTSGDATTNPSTGTGQFDNLLGIGTGTDAMTIDTTAVLGTVTAVLKTGAYSNVQLGVAPFPAYSAKVKGGVEVGGSALYISNKAPVVDQAAAWEYIVYLDSTTSQATWAAGTGYIPIRKSSAATATVQTLWTTEPGYKAAYSQLVGGTNSDATAGAVIGPYTQVRTAEVNAEESMFQSGVSPKQALANARSEIDQVLTQYNRRVS